MALYRALDQEYQGALGQLLQAWPAADEDDAEGWHPTLHRPGWRASARNQLRCTVQAVHAADLDDEVLLRLDADQGFAAQITRVEMELLWARDRGLPVPPYVTRAFREALDLARARAAA